MKRISLLIGLLLTPFTVVQAQNKPNAFIEVFGGLTNPSGQFAKSDYNDLTSGFAKSSYVLGASGAVFFGGNLGLGVTLSQADYGVNTSAIAQGYVGDYAVDEATAYSKHYKFNNLLVGPYYSLAFGKLTLDLRGLVGVSAVTLPALRVVLEDQSTFTQNKATATGFAYQVGAGLRLAVFKHLGVSVRGDYGSTKPKLVVTYDNVNNSSGRTITGYNQSINSLNSTVGIFYQLGR